MTQILTAACPHYVIQVSDRLLTKACGTDVREFDPIANKTVVFRARDAIVTIGYSGIAFVGSMPTDDWIAQTLWGEELPRGRDGKRWATAFGGPKDVLKIGEAAKLLQDRINSIRLASINEHSLMLTIAGFQETGKNIRPIVIEIVHGRSSPDWGQRIWGARENFRFHSIGAGVDVAELNASIEPTRTERGLLGAAPKDIEAAFANAIRGTSAQNSTVGAHLLSVIISRPGLGYSHCRFLPMAPHNAELHGSHGSMIVETMHSPWIVANSLHPPCMNVGTWELGLGPGEVMMVEGAPPQGGLLALSSSVKRPTILGNR
jgi:hypothetical protein